MNASPPSGLPRHGGDLAWASERYGVPADGWLDLSTGINPEPYPAPVIEPETLASLPDHDAQSALIETARTAYRVHTDARLIPVPGTEIALRLLPLVAPAGRVAIVSPTYGSHRESWTNAGREFVEVPALDAVPRNVDLVVLSNPNNPDGRKIAPTTLYELAGDLNNRGGLLVVDEAFADLDPEISLAPHLDEAPAVVLRSFGKFFGLAGLRLGFVAGHPAVVDRLAAMLGDWPVSGAALTIGRTALADSTWQTQTRHLLAQKAGRLRALLEKHALRVIGGTDLFLLVEHADAMRLHEELAEAGIWTRAFPGKPHWLRIGLPPDDQDFARLDAALAVAVR